MPINNEEFEQGTPVSEVEKEIISFLKERKDGAFTSQEIMGGIRGQTDFTTPETARISAFTIADFTALLYDLAKNRKIQMKSVRSRMYFMVSGDIMAKCPKCKVEVAAKKTWKMAGRPDKKGKRTQLHIGLFECPKHGAFRVVLAKQKI